MNDLQADSQTSESLLSAGSELDQLLRAGKKRAAIKYYRKALDCSTKEAKNAVENYMDTENIDPAYAGSAFTPLGILVLIVILSAYFHFFG